MKPKAKVLHPNKLVQQHDEYLVDKNLVNRVKSAKTTIKNSNPAFENRLKSRNKARATTGTGFKSQDPKTDTIAAFATNYVPNVSGMDENLLNYLKALSKEVKIMEKEQSNEDNDGKSAFKDSQLETHVPIVKSQTAASGLSKKVAKVQFPTEKIQKKKEVFQSGMKSYGMDFGREVYFDDDETAPDYELKENDRYKTFEEAQNQRKPNIVQDHSHCNFDSPDIQITSKGILRASTYRQKGEVLDTEESSHYN